MMGLILKNKNILVTGGTGFVGSHLVEELLSQQANVITTFQTLNPLSYFFTQELNKKTMMIQVDICNFQKIFNTVIRHNIDYIFHLAAQALVEPAYYNPQQTLYTNIIGTINVLESARLFPHIRGIIVASSDKAYGKLEKKRYLENDSLKGDHPYEVSKSSADLISQSYYKTYNIPVVITRFGNIYGEGDLNFSRIMPGVMKAILYDETLQIRSNGKYVRDYLYVKDVVSGYILLSENIDKVKGEAFNFGSNDTLTVLDVVKIAENALNKKIKSNILNIAKNEIPFQSLDYTKIVKHTGWKPNFSITQTLSHMFDWYSSILKDL